MEVGNMVEMTGEIVFVMLIVGVVCIGMICMKRIRENELKLEELERKKRMESINNREIQKIADQNLEERKQKLFQTEQRLWELKEKEKYEHFFQKVVMPLQVLLGLSEVSLDTLTEDRISYYISEVITDPIVHAVEQEKGSITDGKLLLSVSEETFDKEKIRKKIEPFGKIELENYIQKNEQRLKTGEVVFQKAGVIEGLGGVIEELKELEQSDTIEKEVVDGLAKRVRQLLEENRIYPMFATDKRLVSYPELKKRYIPLNKNSIRYPGLFIEQDGELEVFGSNIGMDDCGV